jgi:hypothetical protein
MHMHPELLRYSYSFCAEEYKVWSCSKDVILKLLKFTYLTTAEECWNFAEDIPAQQDPTLTARCATLIRKLCNTYNGRRKERWGRPRCGRVRLQ